ncbi:MAG: T9SS type A sorting domain-containing protein [Flavobacteriales bacterium]|nr:T9SS type A sorting domain-containing protein [Flavobacteriales bacterium]
MRTLSLLLMLTVVFTSVQAQDCSGADHTILAGNLYFNPADLTINAGETVAWVNEGGFHDVNGVVSVLTGESFGNPENFSLPSVSGDASGVCMGTHTFTVPGTYNYDCSIGNHAASGMVGSIAVTAPPSGCNDELACNYDADATSDVDCLYDDGTFDFDAGFWLVPAAALDPNFDCDIQPGAGIQVAVLDEAGTAVTVVVDAALQEFVDAGVASGLLTSLEAALLIGALNVATFSFCENTMTGIAGSTTIVSEWNGQSWSIESLGVNLAPVSTLSPGCGNPDALNYDPCTNPDESLCQYTALACDDPLACNYDSTSTGAADCIYFDTGLFSLEENDFIGLTDFEDCETGYPGAYSLPVPLVQDSLGGPLTFVLFPDVESFLVDNGFGIAAQDLATVTMSLCDTVMNYNSVVLGDLDLFWDGLGFTVDVYGSFFAPESSFPIGCPDPDACNFDACSHPFVTDDCTYVFEGPITTAAGDTGFVEFTGDPITFIANVADGITGTWFTDCGGLPPEIDGNTLTLVDPEVGDCEICFDAGSEDCLQTECIIVSVVGSVGETGTAAWSLMPNPAASDLRIEWGGETAVFEVFDLNGRRVHTATLQPGTQVLDVSRLQPGLYLAGPQGAAPRRLAIQR